MCQLLAHHHMLPLNLAAIRQVVLDKLAHREPAKLYSLEVWLVLGQDLMLMSW
jgi:hypothetical protein